jgi:hypothetical protein
MSHYGDLYRHDEESRLVKRFLPRWADEMRLDWRVQVEIAKGQKAQKQLCDLQTAIRVFIDAV